MPGFRLTKLAKADLKTVSVEESFFNTGISRPPSDPQAPRADDIDNFIKNIDQKIEAIKHTPGLPPAAIDQLRDLNTMLSKFQPLVEAYMKHTSSRS